MRHFKLSTHIFFAVAAACLAWTACRHALDPSLTPPQYLEGEKIPGFEMVMKIGSEYSPNGDFTPKFSPDGRCIVYSQLFGHPASGERGLYILDVGTGEQRQLISGNVLHNPDWSPDGEWIVFNNGAQIHKIRTNGDSLTQLTFASRNFFPDWSPDGKHLAYAKSIEDEFGPSGIWMMKNDGTEKEWLARASSPDWRRPAEKSIIGTFGFSPYSVWKRFVIIDIESQQIVNTLDGVVDGNNQCPEYSPDGSRITFHNDDGVWIMNADGSDPKRILPNYYPDGATQQLVTFLPSWRPDGKHIVYEHHRITREVPGATGPIPEGVISFYLVNVDSALARSKL